MRLTGQKHRSSKYRFFGISNPRFFDFLIFRNFAVSGSFILFLRIAVLSLTLLLSSCTSLRYTGVNRIARYDLPSPDVTDSLEGYRIAFASDFHLPSRFREPQLRGTVGALKALHPDVILLGGDYQEGCDYVEPLFAALAEAMPPDGIWAVMGNNDYERCTDEITLSMARHGIHFLHYAADTLRTGLVVVGVPWCTHPPLVSSLVESLRCENFVVLFTHSPDIVESSSVSSRQVDLALAGHTHGGQVTLFGLVTPETGSRYGRRFLAGLNHTSRGVPVITSRGLGTSRMNVRFCAPTDIVLVTLRKSP